MPWVEVEEGHEEVEADGRDGGDDQVCEDVVTEFVGALSAGGLDGVRFELDRDDVDGGEGGVRHDDAVGDHGGEVHFSSTLWSVAHAEDELQADEEDTDVPQDDEDVEADIVAEGVDFGV